MFGFIEQEKYFRQPVVSIGMPVYNSEKYIRIAVESLLSQSFEDFELIIYDNGSKDGTQEICAGYQQFDPRVKFFQSSTRLGFSRLFTRLAEAAVGEYFLLMSPEHKCAPDYLFACIEKMRENPAAVFCFSEKIYIDKNSVPVDKKINLPEPVEFETTGITREQSFRMLLSHPYRSVSYGLFRTAVLKKEVYFPDIFGSYMVFMAGLLLAGDFVRVSQPLFYYRYIENEITAYSLEKLMRAYNNSNDKLFTRLARELIKAISGSALSAKQKDSLKENLLEILSEKGSNWQKKLFSENDITDSSDLKPVLFEKDDKKVFYEPQPGFNESLFSEKEKQVIGEISEYFKAGNYTEALILTENLLSSYPVNDYLLNLRGELYFYSKDYEKAINAYLKLLELYPLNSSYFANAAVCFWQKRRIPEALRLFRRAVQLDSDNYMAVINYFMALDCLGYYDEINSLFLTCIKGKPDTEAKFISLAESIVKSKLNEAPEKENLFLVSAILIHNDPSALLFEKLEELEQQTIREKMEIIVIDATGDYERKTAEIKNHYPDIIYIPVQKYSGVYELWNEGIKAASGKYLTIVKSNTMYWKDIFEDMADELEANNFLGFVYTDIIITYDSDKNSENYGESDLVIFHDWDRNTFLREGYPVGLQTMWRKKIHNEYGYFDEKVGELADYEFLLRISQTNEIKHLKYFIGFYIDFSYNIEEQEFSKLNSFNSSSLKKEYIEAYEANKVIKRKSGITDLSFESKPERGLLDISVYKKSNFYLDTIPFRDFRMLPEQSSYILIRNKQNTGEIPVTYYNNILDQIWVKTGEEQQILLKKGVKEDKIKIIPVNQPWAAVFKVINEVLGSLDESPVRLGIKRYSKEYYYNFAFSLYLQKKYKEAIVYFLKGMDIDAENVPDDIMALLSQCYKNTGSKNKGIIFPN